MTRSIFKTAFRPIFQPAFRHSAFLGLSATAALVACVSVEQTDSEEIASGNIVVSTDITGLSPEAGRIKQHIAFLADDQLEGREAGTRGYDLAATYVAEQYDAIGLTPGGEDESWMQNVRLRSIKADLEKSEMTVSRDDKTTTLTHIEDFLGGGSAQDTETDVTAGLVFAGYGLVAPEFGVNDYAGLDVEGKIVVILGGTPQGVFPSEEGAHFGGTKNSIAEEQGAVGVITVYSPQLSQRFPWQRVSRGAGRTQVTWVQKDGNTFSTAPGIKATAFMNPEATEILFEGAEKSYADVLEAAAEEGSQPKGFDLTGEVTLKSARSFSDLSSSNVAGVIEGSDPELKDEYVVLTAHLDHIGISESDDPEADVINNGALDNASGVATMIEVARRMVKDKENGKGPRRSVIFLALTAEEKGLIGAQYYAYNPTVPQEDIVANVNLDMALLLYHFEDLIAFGADHSSLGPIVEKAAAEMDVVLIEDPMPEQSIFTRSDHYRFVQQGIPSVFLWPGYANGGEEIIKNFLANEYHSPADQLDLPIDYEQGVRFANLNHLVATAIANDDVRPTWNEGDFFGNLYGKK